MAGTRSTSESSDVSAMAYGTVQQRSKSTSPSKQQETLEWKRRLVRGQLGYGDQTDLFGPSGLENIFAKSAGPENEAPKPKNRMGWLQKSDVPMPSSPPPWPSSLADQSHPDVQENDEGLEPVAEDNEDGTMDTHRTEDSFRSNPFDLEVSEYPQAGSQHDTDPASPHQSSPDKAFIEPTQDEGPGNRTYSGQTELEQEDFSPVFISKHHTVSGQVDYAALDSHVMKKFQSLKVNLSHPSQQKSAQSGSDSEYPQNEVPEQSTITDKPDSQSLPGVPDLSFSENLPTGSPVPNLGENVQLRRGGYSQCGSFKQRPLSPSQSAVETSNNPDASGLLSPLPSDIEPLPAAPTRPRTPGISTQAEEPQSRSSGSPLKLFGAHDTFTNNRLLRRLSQLNPDGTIRQSPVHVDENQSARKVSSCSSFGNGELEDHGFDAQITVTSASNSDKNDSDCSPGSEVPVPGSKTPLGFRFEVSLEVKDTFKLKRKLSKHSATTSKASSLESQPKPQLDLKPTVEEVSESRVRAEAPPLPTKSYAEGKRPPTSPFKNPTPKRRRTLHASELENINHSYHSQLQEAVSSRKRKDARHGESHNTADPAILAQRKILRPRNPTPSQCRRQQIEAELREAAEEFAEQEPRKLEAVMEQIESSMTSDDAPPTLQQQARALASEVAAFTLKVHKPSGEQGERKRSVTTQDFLDEAMMVMNLIRAKARPQSNLGSVEESDAEALALSVRADGTQSDESLLRVSRPPSREGTGWRRPGPVQTGARVMSHLRKFEEREERDDTDFIANSIASLQMDDDERVNEQVVVVDEHSNIRITGPPIDQGREEAASDSRPGSQRSQGSTLDTQGSGGTSTGRTIGTSSTRKSDNVGTLAPDAVAHLIGEQVGGMTFDKDKQRWVRVSKSPEKGNGSFLELPSNVTSDDDPFREISDLPVDEQKELRRISSPGKPAQENALAEQNSSVPDEATQSGSQQHAAESRTTSHETVIPRPATRDSSLVHHNHSSSVPSRYTAFASSQQEKVETRATSWSDEELAQMSAIGKARHPSLAYYAAPKAPLAQQSVSGGDQKTSAQEASQIKFPSPPNRRLPTDVAAVDHAQLHSTTAEDESADDLAGLRDDTALDLADSDIEDIDSPKLRQTPSKAPFPSTSTYRTATRQMSLRRKTLTSRFTTETHEQSELSFVAPLPGDRMMSLSLSVSRPVSTRQQHGQVNELQSSPSKGSSSFILSDLPDFTVHDVDPERPSERALATRLAQHAAAEVNDRYALAVKDLVKTLTDCHEDEPFWEDLKQLDLHARHLASLYGLSDFCTHIQEMDVSNNALGHLHGAPVTLRRLNVRSNQLSSLTSWNHLWNLQYLDISDNHLDDLNGLGSLIHLRELRADDNAITMLDGLFELDSLLKLRVRRNKLQQVDFEDSQLNRLTALDLSGNQISSVRYLDKLESLAELKLDGNRLKDGLQTERPLSQLTSLSLQNCDVGALDVSNIPGLKHVLVDDNRLANIAGLGKLKNLLLLSMKRQSLPVEKTISIFDQPLEARTVRLSGNAIPSMNLSTSLFSIRHLEVASVGLQELPEDFGLRMPNLTTLNLNYNSLKDIRPLLNIQKLEQLSVCGNRLHRLRKSVATFSRLTTLRTLDIRDNPLTQGFYASIASTMSRNTSVVCKVRGRALEDEDQQAAEFESCRYEFPSGDVEQDRQHRARLDEDTRLRRRVYEMLSANSCPNLSELDGLKLDKATAGAKDSIWKRLVELGIIRRSQHSALEL